MPISATWALAWLASLSSLFFFCTLLKHALFNEAYYANLLLVLNFYPDHLSCSMFSNFDKIYLIKPILTNPNIFAFWIIAHMLNNGSADISHFLINIHSNWAAVLLCVKYDYKLPHTLFRCWRCCLCLCLLGVYSISVLIFRVLGLSRVNFGHKWRVIDPHVHICCVVFIVSLSGLEVPVRICCEGCWWHLIYLSLRLNSGSVLNYSKYRHYIESP